MDTDPAALEAARLTDITAVGDLISGLIGLWRANRAASAVPPGPASEYFLPLLEHLAERARQPAQGHHTMAEVSGAVTDLVQQYDETSNPVKAMGKTLRSRPVTRRELSPGALLFREGDWPDERAYILESGRVQLLKTGEAEVEVLLDISEPGDIIGEWR